MKCNVHTERECMPTCPGRFGAAQPVVVAVQVAPTTHVPGKLCGLCRAQREKRLGPIEVESAATIRDCDVCALTIARAERHRAKE